MLGQTQFCCLARPVSSLMESPLIRSNEDHSSEIGDEENDQNILIDGLPRGHSWGLSSHLRRYEGFWYHSVLLRGTLKVQHKFKTQPNDVIICSHPKTGTTWLKALCFAILTRQRFGDGCTSQLQQPLLTNLPHDCVPFLEVDLGTKKGENPTGRDTEKRLLSTHVPYSALPRSEEVSGGGIVYICRDPKDVFISLWHFVAKVVGKKESNPPPLEEAFDFFCDGVSLYGPYWDRVIGYWEASLRHPHRIMFLKYEELMRDQISRVRRLADFVGRPFSSDEEEKGLVGGIIGLCSFESLSNLEVNKNGKHQRDTALAPAENNAFFRKGEVGDWRNYLCPEMIRRIDTITEEKFGRLGLTIGDEG